MKKQTNMISQNLTALRQYHKYSQEEVAEKVGVTRQAVAKWEIEGKSFFPKKHGTFSISNKEIFLWYWETKTRKAPVSLWCPEILSCAISLFCAIC